LLQKKNLELEAAIGGLRGDVAEAKTELSHAANQAVTLQTSIDGLNEDNRQLVIKNRELVEIARGKS